MVKNMKKNDKYILLKKSIYKTMESYDFNESFNMSKKKDDERIGVIKFYDEKIINQVVQRSVDNRFKKLLELLSKIEESDEDPSEGLLLCLDEVSRFKMEMINKYNKFLKKIQIDLVNKKIELIEKEIKNKLLECRMIHTAILDKIYEDDEEEIVDERRHSR